MALVVETGAGLPNAEAYVSLAAFKAYADARGYAYDTYTDPEIEQAIVRATAYVDTCARYKGSKLSAAQALEFPRDGLTDWGGLDIVGVPRQVAHATSELAFKGLSEPLYVDLDRGGKVTSESVGPISVSYAPDAPAGKVFRAAQHLLQQFFRDKQTIGVPFFSTSEQPVFTMSTMEFPGNYPPGTDPEA